MGYDYKNSRYDHDTFLEAPPSSYIEELSWAGSGHEDCAYGKLSLDDILALARDPRIPLCEREALLTGADKAERDRLVYHDGALTEATNPELMKTRRIRSAQVNVAKIDAVAAEIGVRLH